MEDASTPSAPPSFLIISRHDYRSKRKANMHFITRELAKKGKTRFFSFGFSYISYFKEDPRLSLWERSNCIESVENVECYLWRTPVHPVSLRKPYLRTLERFCFERYLDITSPLLKRWISESSTIVLESGFPVIYIALCRKLNPRAKLIYIASDGLKTIDCAQYILDVFKRDAYLLDGIRLPSHKLYEEMPNKEYAFFVPHGLDKDLLTASGPSPYGPGLHAVSVGSMLFDPAFFEIAANAFPQVTFHVIGGGKAASGLSMPNIKSYGEMPFKETLPYIRHAAFGIAPYDGKKVAPFLVDTSMKLMQYGSMGVPAVCPQLVAGQYKGRFGYAPGDTASIVGAINEALEFGHFSGAAVLGWEEVVDRILAPQSYEDTKVRAA